MKRIIILMLVIGLALPVSIAAAATVIVQNYFYAHANTPGTFYFKDKFGTEIMYGDNIQHDAEIKKVRITAQGMEPGDQILIYKSGGASIVAHHDGNLTDVNTTNNQYIRIAIVKTGYNEVFAKMDEMYTFDQSDGGTNVLYSYSVNEIPTEYGDLGPGENVDIVTGNYYYWPPQDQYKYDYPPPSGVSYYELHFDGSAGHFQRTFNHAPTGVHYLTCNGTYEMRFFDAGGVMLAKSSEMVTTQIQTPTCDSQPGTGAGYHDFDLTKGPDPQLPDYDLLEWDAYPGAYDYEIYRNGQLIDTFNGTSLRINRDDAAYSVVALDSNGQPIAQADLTGSNGDPGGGDPGGGGSCNGCDKLREILACPEWQQYLGGLTQAIKNAWPDPPYWQGVANIMRDTIVPAMGQELVNRAPEIAVIIADEFERREDPVYPPGALAAYNPPYAIPTPADMASQIPFDLNSGVPDFEPDFSGSQPFTIPDPFKLELSDADAGYVAPDPTPSNNPILAYQQTEPTAEPDPGYGGSISPVDDTPGYVVTNPGANEPTRDYAPPTPPGDSGPIPGYQPPPGDSGSIPGYQLPSDQMPPYERSD